MPPIILEAVELAERLEVTSRTILSWARRGHIPCIRDGRRKILFNLDQVLQALRARQEATRCEGREGVSRG